MEIVCYIRIVVGLYVFSTGIFGAMVGVTAPTSNCSADEYGPNCTFCKSIDTCVEGHYTCDKTGSKQCLPGWQGDFCTQPVDNGGYSVTCPENRCRNGGTCSHGNCCCLPGYTGILCEIEIIECTNHSCLNGGICKDDIDKYTCMCIPGFSGSHCEVKTSVTSGGTTTVGSKCSLTPCNNGGSCFEDSYFRYCVCPTGYTGKNCETLHYTIPMINKCTNGQYGMSCDVVCIAMDNCEEGHYNCDPATGQKVCLSGWRGVRCNTRVLPQFLDTACVGGISCKNDGQCSAGKCCCKNNFSGEYCQIESIGCVSSPCKNNGTCNTLGNSFTCTCVANFTGQHCDVDLTTLTTPRSPVFTISTSASTSPSTSTSIIVTGPTSPNTGSAQNTTTNLTSQSQTQSTLVSYIASTTGSSIKPSPSTQSYSSTIPSDAIDVSSTLSIFSTMLSPSTTVQITSTRNHNSDIAPSSTPWLHNSDSIFPSGTFSSDLLESSSKSNSETLYSSSNFQHVQESSISSLFDGLNHQSSIQPTNTLTVASSTSVVMTSVSIETTEISSSTTSTTEPTSSTKSITKLTTKDVVTDSTKGTIGEAHPSTSSLPTSPLSTSSTGSQLVKDSTTGPQTEGQDGRSDNSSNELDWWIILVIVCGVILLIVIIILIILVFVHQRRRDSRTLQEYQSDETRFDKEHFSVQPDFSNPAYDLNADSDDDSVKQDMYIVNKG